MIDVEEDDGPGESARVSTPGKRCRVVLQMDEDPVETGLREDGRKAVSRERFGQRTDTFELLLGFVLTLLRLVVSDRLENARLHGDDVPSPRGESCLGSLPGISGGLPMSHTVDSRRMLEEALYSVGEKIDSWVMFCSSDEVLNSCCHLHGVISEGDESLGDSLLKHFFTGMCFVGDSELSQPACREVCQRFPCHADLVVFIERTCPSTKT